MRDSHASTGHRGGANTDGAGDFGEAAEGKKERRDRESRRGARRSSSEQRDGVGGRRQRGKEKCHAFGSEDARSRNLEKGCAAGSRAVALAVQAAQEWAKVAPLMDQAKKAANRGLYGLINDSAESIGTLNDSMVNWDIPGAPATKAIGTEEGGAGHSPNTADKHSPRTSLACAQHRAQEMNALRSKRVETSLTQR
ncbi:hypothetical protein ERJ75_001803300 [Trypanosoma vivax]|nr:hypothetical protein ERJ75_001803300 [Trypanosoma vivax]